MRSLFGLSPGGVCRAGLLPGSRCALTAPFHPCHAPRRTVRRFAFCCTFRRPAPPRRYLAPCPVEPGLPSAPFRPTRLPCRLLHGTCLQQPCPAAANRCRPTSAPVPHAEPLPPALA